MIVRITPYKMRPETREAAAEVLDLLKDQIMGLQGISEFLNVSKEDGSGYVVALVESHEAIAANAEKVKEIWSNFNEFLEAVPEPQDYEIMAHWKN